MTKQPVRRFTMKRLAMATLILSVLGGLVLGAAGASAALPRERGGKAVACLQLRGGSTMLESRLDALVENGTISAEQQASIVDQLRDSVTAGARGCTGMDLVRDKAAGDAVTELLGIDRGDIRIAWLDGQSLTEIAEAQGIDRETLIGTITTALVAKLTEAVDQGRISTELKAEIEAALPAKIEQAVDMRLSDLVDALRDKRDGSNDPATPISTTGSSSLS